MEPPDNSDPRPLCLPFVVAVMAQLGQSLSGKRAEQALQWDDGPSS